MQSITSQDRPLFFERAGCSESRSECCHACVQVKKTARKLGVCGVPARKKKFKSFGRRDDGAIQDAEEVMRNLER